MVFINSLPGAISQGLIWGLMAIGLFITYKILDFADLTVDGSMVTGAVVCIVLVSSGVNVWLAMIIAFLAGCLAGLVTGIFHTVMGIPPILAGILTQLSLWSINLKILGRANMTFPIDRLLIQTEKLQCILILLGFTAVVIAALYWFFGTAFGSSIRSTGCNQNMSKAQGINTNSRKVVALMLSNGIVALSGALLAQYQGFADINMGRGAIVIGLAAVIIGTAVVSWISKNFAVQLIGVAIGGVIYYLVYQFIINLGFDTDLLKMLSAIVVAIFLAVPYWKKKFFKNKKTVKKDETKTDGVKETE